MGTRSQARVPRDSWSTSRDIAHGPEAPGTSGQPWALGPGPESPGTVGQHRGTSDQGPSRARQLVDPAGSQTRPRIAERAGRPRGPSDATASCGRQLIDTAGSQTRTRGPRNYWSTPRGLGYSPVLPRKLVDHGPSDPDRSHLGVLVDPTGPWTLARIAQDSWSTLWALGPGHDLPGGACRHRGP